MKNKLTHSIAILILISIFIVLSAVNTFQSKEAESNQTQKIDWGHKAWEITSQDQQFRELAGDNPDKITSIVWEGSHAYSYYNVNGKIYNVTVDLKNENVTSVVEEKDGKKLEWLRNFTMEISASELIN